MKLDFVMRKFMTSDCGHDMHVYMTHGCSKYEVIVIAVQLLWVKAEPPSHIIIIYLNSRSELNVIMLCQLYWLYNYIKLVDLPRMGI